jgi:hypothetical protein
MRSQIWLVLFFWTISFGQSLVPRSCGQGDATRPSRSLSSHEHCRMITGSGMRQSQSGRNPARKIFR